MAEHQKKVRNLSCLFGTSQFNITKIMFCMTPGKVNKTNKQTNKQTLQFSHLKSIGTKEERLVLSHLYPH